MGLTRSCHQFSALSLVLPSVVHHASRSKRLSSTYCISELQPASAQHEKLAVVSTAQAGSGQIRAISTAARRFPVFSKCNSLCPIFDIILAQQSRGHVHMPIASCVEPGIVILFWCPLQYLSGRWNRISEVQPIAPDHSWWT